MENLVSIKLHGNAFEGIKDSYKLAVKSVREAIHAINTITKSKFYSRLAENDKKGVKYKVVINGRELNNLDQIKINDEASVRENELTLSRKNLQTIDLVPVIEGADENIGAIIAGVVLIIVGVVFSEFLGPFAAAFIMAGVGLIAAGVINLLSQPPKFEDFREVGGQNKASYLFNGPENTINEGGPVPVGYGRLLVGSQVIAASYEIGAQNAKTILTS